MDLNNDNLLQKFLLCKTRNNNESTNGAIWKHCPKDIFVGRITLEASVASAVIYCNDVVCGI